VKNPWLKKIKPGSIPIKEKRGVGLEESTWEGHRDSREKKIYKTFLVNRRRRKEYLRVIP